MSMKNEDIQKEIIQVLNEQKECAFGVIVKRLNYSYSDVLHNVLELKNKGTLQKSKKTKGNYALA